MKIATSEKDLSTCLDELVCDFSIDLETTSLYPWHGKINTIGLGLSMCQWIIPVHHEESNLSKKQVKVFLIKLMGVVKRRKLRSSAHNAKFEMLWIKVHFDLDLVIDDDIMLMHYLLDENDFHDLKGLVAREYGVRYDIDTKEKQGNTTLEKLAIYNGLDCLYTRRFVPLFRGKLAADPALERVYDHIMMPCVWLFTQAEYNGVYIDTSRMNEVELELRRRTHRARKTLSKWAPPDINWRSPQQVAKFLFDDLKLTPLDKTKGGAYSTSESVLLRLAEKHPAPKALIDYRGANQLLTTFIEGWKPYLDGNVLHPSFKLHGTVTGRLSCENPNLQQIPRDPLIRSLIVGDDEWEVVEADLSQIELRIAAELANEPAMLHAFATGVDIHWITALDNVDPDQVVEVAEKLSRRNSRMSFTEAKEYLLKIGIDAVTDKFPEWKEIRKKAKAINFGYLYGMWWKKFMIYARDNYGVKVKPAQAQQSRNKYFKTFAALEDWHKRQKSFARRNGYVRSLSGRKRRLPDAMSPYDTPQRGEAERQAINSPVQSFANELNLMAALEIHSLYSKDIKIIGTVHDAILMRIRKTKIAELVPKVMDIMSWPKLMTVLKIDISVPIEAEVKIGPWGKGISLDKYLRAKQ